MIIQYLSQPYPLNKGRWKIILGISLFISLFMVFFQPFGLSSFNNEYRFFFETGFGLVTLLVLVLLFFVFPVLFRDFFAFKNWTVIKQIIWQLWILFCIGNVNFLYSSFFLQFSDNLNAFFNFQLYTMMVGIIPVIVMTIINQNRLLAENLKIAHEYNSDYKIKTEVETKEEFVCLVAENNKDKLEIKLSDLIYVTSNGNYVHVFYLKDKELRNIMLRNTLKQTEEQLIENHSIIKCHRAFLVNKNKIVRMKGNSQGPRLILKGTDEEIPVSRKLSKGLMSIMNT